MIKPDRNQPTQIKYFDNLIYENIIMSNHNLRRPIYLEVFCHKRREKKNNYTTIAQTQYSIHINDGLVGWNIQTFYIQPQTALSIIVCK